MSGAELYLRIITEDDMEWCGKHGNVLDGDVTMLTDLRQIDRPHGNGEGRRKERVIVEHADGTTEEIVGHVVGSGPTPP